MLFLLDMLMELFLIRLLGLLQKRKQHQDQMLVHAGGYHQYLVDQTVVRLSKTILLPPSVLRPSETHSDQETIEIAVTKLLLRSYYDIVRKNIEDLVLKAIMHFLVNHTKRELHNVFIKKLYRDNLLEEMLQEPDEIAMKRKRTRETLHVLQQAFKTLEEAIA